ncbi:Tet(A)/Tet(B)/Tet(C) family tetracycline efflux MFS transporter [Emcibacter sp. SYSU 3D8]|uniref:Tet(A)/Tet(B)/Tet(C) family tetracycline efflux MFS transporter n=1 Tax=Emcibacter sp. SYSU 3D8 TaxID=3133969 RepID=UPI0031FED205
MNKALTVILATVALDAIGIGLIMPILPSLLRELGHSSEISAQYGMLLALYAAMQFLFGPVLGALSDRFGRRPILLVALAGAAVDYLIMAMTDHLAILYVGRAIAGIAGASFVVATAYIADISLPAERARRYGLMQACFGIGFIAGPVLGGLLGELSLRYPFLLAAALNGINFVVGLFVLPESHLPERRKVKLASLNPLASFRWAFGMRTLVPLIAIFFTMHLVGQVPGSLWVIYGEDRFAWDTWMVGLSLGVFGLFHAVAQAFLTGPVTARLGEKTTLALGVAFDATGLVLMAYATTTWMVLPVLMFLTLSGVGIPALQSMVSRQVDEDQQGELQGTVAALMSLASIFGPLAATAFYAATAATWSGMVWVAAAALYVLLIPALLAIRRH